MAELRATVPKTTFGWARTLGLVGLVLFLFVLGSVSSPAMGRLSVSRATAPSAAPVLLGHAPPPAIHVRPLAGSPTIFSFSVAPKTIFEGYPTTFTTNAAGGTGNLTYAYTGLPPGCTSANVSVLFCGPTDNGTFKVTVNVTDINHNATLANTTLFVEPYTSGQFWVHNSTFSDLPQSQQVCSTVNSAPFYSVSCYSSSQFPSLLSLSNGHLGVGYEMYTHSTANTCTGAAVGTTARIGWTSSSDGGIQFGAPANIGNLSCQYLNAIEPSFVNSGSSVYGAFVEENGSSAILPSNYGARASDALGFVSSANNGATWSPVRTLVGTGDIARPEMAAIGNTLYLVYEDVANSSTAIAGGWLPISVEFTVSTNAGGTWSPPVTLPGLNKTASYDAFAPSIAVSPLGPVTVAYATNRSCVNPGAAGACATYGDNIYTTTSANNGSAWGTLELVASAIGESTCYSSGCLPSYFQSTPETSIAIDGAGSLYVAYAGTFNSHSFNPANNYRWTGSYYAVSANGGTSWTTQTIGQAAPGWQTNYFNPSVGVHGTNVVLAYSEDNETLGTAAYDGSLSEWTTNASTGVAGKLTPSILTGIVAMPFGRLTNFTRYSYVGMTSSVTFNATGWPLLAYSLAQTPSVKVKSGPGYYYTNTTYGTNLTVAYRALRTNYAQVVNVTFTEVGLPINESWQFTI
ncbi:MAG: glycoside hydrolase, partial [Thermoplasmata archaeon]|nr:glycoside hydrolase [Thermoplasmata archaeon]